MGSIEQYGIVLEASVEEYEQNIIKKHEQTREKKEKDRTIVNQLFKSFRCKWLSRLSTFKALMLDQFS